MKQKITLRARAGKCGVRGVSGFAAAHREVVLAGVSRASRAARANPPKPDPARSKNSRRDVGVATGCKRERKDEVMVAIKSGETPTERLLYFKELRRIQ